MSIILTISRVRETAHDDWFSRDCYSRNYIQDIPDPSGGRTKKVLTAIPSPFARMHLFETAFEILNQENNFEGDSAYHKIVSDCFDVLDLMFNWDLHQKSNASLKIVSWTQRNQLANLINSQHSEHKLVGETLKLFLEQDRETSNFNYADTIYLLLLNNEVFAGTSPMTMFFTRPDLNSFALTRPNCGNMNYFSTIVPLYKRDEEFQLFVHRMFKSFRELQISAKQVYSYLMKTKELASPDLRSKINELWGSDYNQNELQTEYDILLDQNSNAFLVCGQSMHKRKGTWMPPDTLKLKSSKLPNAMINKVPLVLEDFHNSSGQFDGITKVPKKLINVPYEQRILPDNNFNYPYLVVSDFLEDTLIFVEYPINKANFKVGNYNNPDGRGYLLPLTKKYFEFFNFADVDTFLKVQKVGDGYKVDLSLPTIGGKIIHFEKLYYESPQDDNLGKIINARFSLAMFPFFKIKDKPQFNNFYKMMFIDEDSSPLYINQEYSLRFYCDNTEFSDDERANYHVEKHVRIKKTEKLATSVYYSFNSYFDFIEVETPHEFSRRKAKGLIIPVWKEIRISDSKKLTFAIDFGTTNTTIAYTEDENYQQTPKTLTIDESDMQVVMLNAPNTDSNVDKTQKYEDVATFIRAAVIPRQRHEFIPSIIGEGNFPEYSFPIRTAVSEQIGLDVVNIDSLKLLSNINISFVYPKEGARWEEEELTTDLKWSMKINSKNVARIEMFISELLYIIRNKVLLNSSNPANCKIIWSYPLSLDNFSQSQLQTIWNKYTSKILNTTINPIKVTESEAPFYFYDKKLNLSDDANLCIDIGGGSTDVAFFLKKKAEFGTSFNYGGNAFWGSGFSQLTGDHSRIIQYYMDYIVNHDLLLKMSGHKKAQLNSILCYINKFKEKIRTEEVANIYFAWDKEIHFSELLGDDSKVRFLILFFYASLMYHILQIMKYKNLSPPKFISFSGLGSKVLDILEKNPQKPMLKKFTIELVKKVYEVEDYNKVEFYTTDLPKESTAYGCIFVQGKEHAELRPLTFLGESGFKGFNNEINLVYSQIDDNLKKQVVENVLKFIETFFGINSKFNFKNNFGLDINLRKVNGLVRQNINELLEKGLRYRRSKVEDDDPINETLFFYPLIGVLNELGNEWFTQREEE